MLPSRRHAWYLHVLLAGFYPPDYTIANDYEQSGIFIFYEQPIIHLVVLTLMLCILATGIRTLC